MHRSAPSVLAMACCLAACVQMKEMVAKPPSATASLLPTKGSEVQGSVKLVQRGENVVVSGKVTGLAPGAHGFHVHEKGDCSAPDASSAGPHFDPAGSKAHGGPTGSSRHGGDLGNITADAKGVAQFEVIVHGISLGTDAGSVVGRSIIVHAKPDDLATQPSGNSGPRLACGLISREP